MNNLFVHCGHFAFDKRLFNPIRNESIPSNKPAPGCGFWASPIEESGALGNWLEWCEENDFRTEKYCNAKFEFSMSDMSKILVVTNREQLEAVPQVKPEDFDERDRVFFEMGGGHTSSIFPDFERIAETYDGMFVKIYSKGYGTGWDEQAYWRLYGWDVDSLLVFNPEAIVPSRR